MGDPISDAICTVGMIVAAIIAILYLLCDWFSGRD